MTENIFMVLIAVLVISLVTIAWYHAKKIRTAQDFFLHGEDLDQNPFVATLVSSNLSLGNMIFICAIMGYAYGYSGIFWVVVTIISLGVGFYCFGDRFKTYIEDKGNFGTLHDFIALGHCADDHRQQSKLKLLAAVVTCISLCIAIVIEAHLGTLFMMPLLDIPHIYLMVGFLIAVFVYTTVAGFYTVVATDMIQFWMMVLAIVGGFLLFTILPDQQSFSDAGYSYDVVSIVGGAGAPTAVGLVVLGFFWLIATPDTWQRNCATRKYPTTSSGIYIGVAIMCVAVACFAIFGMLVNADVTPLIGERGSAGLYPLNDIFLLDLDQYGLYVSIGAALFGAGLIMAAISTIDTFVIVLGHILNVDIGLSRKGYRRLDDVDDDAHGLVILRGQALILVMAFVVFCLWLILRQANWLYDPLSLFFVTYTLQFCLAIPVITATIPKFRSYTASFYQIVISAVLTLVVGIFAMNNLSSQQEFLNLTAGSWMAMLPLVPIMAGIICYLPLLRQKKIKGQ